MSRTFKARMDRKTPENVLKAFEARNQMNVHARRAEYSLRPLKDPREAFEVLDREFDEQNEADVLREIACGARMGDRS